LAFELGYLPIEILNGGVESSDLRDYLIPASALGCQLIEPLDHLGDFDMNAADLPLRADTCFLEFHGSHLTLVSPISTVDPVLIRGALHRLLKSTMTDKRVADKPFP
jgi:hypothetical protein